MFGPGLEVTWQGLGTERVRLTGSTLLVSERQLPVFAPTALNRRSRDGLLLWQESDSPRRSSVDISFEKPFPVLYVSSRDGDEVLVATGAASAHLDRPIYADAGRPRFGGATAKLLLTETSRGQTLLLD